jgi:hypothetical protein
MVGDSEAASEAASEAEVSEAEVSEAEVSEAVVEAVEGLCQPHSVAVTSKTADWRSNADEQRAMLRRSARRSVSALRQRLNASG